ncbi:MAG: SGNH/GDSL hydrolase family protein [Armatimonadetes bacterium]|nr:SGNH/GDSL hydrolase family protein [Candidatus Hippobium faecium]
MKVAILGNSITKHGFCEPVGWYANYGMAASSAEKDFAHLLMKKFSSVEKCEFFVQNIADFERFFENPYGVENTCDQEFNRDKAMFVSIEANYQKIIEFDADIIIFAIGENISDMTTELRREHLYTELIRLMKILGHNGKAKIFVRSQFWPETVKDRILEKACNAVGGHFIDISDEGGLLKYFAHDGRKFWHEGVANHPGDEGMKMIAEKIWEEVEKYL